MKTKVSIALLACMLVAACAVRMGGGAPEERRALAMDVAAGISADSVGKAVRAADAQVVLLSAQADTAWFGQLARASGLVLSGPGLAGTQRLAFLAKDSAVGDTTITLAVEGGDSLVVHDALYKIDKNRNLDLMVLRLTGRHPLRATIRSLLSYIATDVGGDAAVIIAVDVDEPARGDSVATLLSPAFADTRLCIPSSESATGANLKIRMFYGPQMRTECRDARAVTRDAVRARIVIDG
jgi:hypothetical protein